MQEHVPVTVPPLGWADRPGYHQPKGATMTTQQPEQPNTETETEQPEQETTPETEQPEPEQQPEQPEE